MRRNLAIVFVLCLFQIMVKAQDSKILAGAGICYASEINNIGFYLTGTYRFTDKWEAAPTFTYFLKKDYTNWSTLDLNAHYVFLDNEKVKVYGLAGLNFTFWKFKMTASDLGIDEPEEGENDYMDDFWNLYDEEFESKGTETGFNLGIGLRLPVSDRLSINAETKYTFSSLGFVSLGAGILYTF